MKLEIEFSLKEGGVSVADEDEALGMIMERFKGGAIDKHDFVTRDWFYTYLWKFYRKEYKRLLKENGELWEENQKIKKSYDALKAVVVFFCSL